MDVTHNDWEDDKPSEAKRFRVRILSVTLSVTFSLTVVFKSPSMKLKMKLFSGFIFYFYQFLKEIIGNLIVNVSSLFNICTSCYCLF